MPIWRVDLAYDGSGFRGYAHQNGLRTVQGELDRALALVLGETVETSVAGRTDAGAHALGQVVSFEYGDLDAEQVARSLNGIVGPEVSVFSLSPESNEFSARFSAKWRRYRYLIDQGSAPDPMRRHEAWFPGRRLDLAVMQEVATELVGEKDFSSFCRSVEGKSNVRRVESAEWKVEEPFLEFWIKANAFCHQMVRSLVGFSYDVGRGFAKAGTIAEVIDARDRGAVATVAPPHGLTLWDVGY